MLEIARQQPADAFVILTNETLALTNLPVNVTNRLIKTGLFKWVEDKWWYNLGLPQLLKRQKADLFVTIDNTHIKGYKTPCCHFIVNLPAAGPGFANGYTRKWKRIYHNNQVAGILQTAVAIITFSGYHKRMLVEKFKLPPEKCNHLRLCYHNTPLKWPEKESIKTRYSGGLEYFVFAGDIDQRHLLVELLKAYAEFKRWQKSNMQLIVTGSVTAWTQQFLTKLAYFKYRNDVHVIPDPTDDILKALIGSAYALLYPALNDHFPETVLLAMRADVPVIASPVPVIKELANCAVIYPEPDNASGFAKSMQDIYKNERLREDVILSARNHMEQGKKYNLATVCRNLLWQTLDKNSY